MVALQRITDGGKLLRRNDRLSYDPDCCCKVPGCTEPTLTALVTIENMPDEIWNYSPDGVTLPTNCVPAPPIPFEVAGIPFPVTTYKNESIDGLGVLNGEYSILLPERICTGAAFRLDEEVSGLSNFTYYQEPGDDPYFLCQVGPLTAVAVVTVQAIGLGFFYSISAQINVLVSGGLLTRPILAVPLGLAVLYPTQINEVFISERQVRINPGDTPDVPQYQIVTMYAQITDAII